MHKSVGEYIYVYDFDNFEKKHLSVSLIWSVLPDIQLNFPELTPYNVIINHNYLIQTGWNVVKVFLK